MFRDLLDEDGHILTHNFRPIQPLGDRIILFNIIDNDDNTLAHPEDELPPLVDVDDNDLDLTNDVKNVDKNVLKDSPDNKLDEGKADSKTKKSKLGSGSMTHFVSLYVLSIALLAFILSGNQIC